MGNYIPNLVMVDGKLVRLKVRKGVGEMFADKAGKVAAAALQKGKGSKSFFAIRYSDAWHIYQINYHVPKLTCLTEAAAAMWLMHRD